MKKSKETLKLTAHTFVDKKTAIISFAFIFILTGRLFSEGSMDDSGDNSAYISPNKIIPAFLMEEGEYSLINLIGYIEHKLNEMNEMKYFLILDGTIIIRTYYTTQITEFDTPSFLGQDTIIHIEPVEIFEMEIEFTEQCPLERLLEIFDTRWGYIATGTFFFLTLDNDQKKFIIKLERINMNG
jgi:hypothetical protein